MSDSLDKITSWIPQVNASPATAGNVVELFSIFERQNAFFGLPVDDVAEVITLSSRRGYEKTIVLSDGKTSVSILIIDELLGLPTKFDQDIGVILVIQHLPLAPLAIQVDRILGVLTVNQKEVRLSDVSTPRFIRGSWNSPELHENVTLLSVPDLCPLLTGELTADPHPLNGAEGGN